MGRGRSQARRRGRRANAAFPSSPAVQGHADAAFHPQNEGREQQPHPRATEGRGAGLAPPGQGLVAGPGVSPEHSRPWPQGSSKGPQDSTAGRACACRGRPGLQPRAPPGVGAEPEKPGRRRVRPEASGMWPKGSTRPSDPRPAAPRPDPHLSASASFSLRRSGRLGPRGRSAAAKHFACRKHPAGVS